MNQHHHQHKHHAPKKGLHKDWRMWFAVALMLAAMVAYVASPLASATTGAALRVDGGVVRSIL